MIKFLYSSDFSRRSGRLPANGTENAMVSLSAAFPSFLLGQILSLQKEPFICSPSLF